MKVSDPRQFTVSYGGVPLHGFADGEFVTVKFVSDAALDVVGTDGEVSVSPNADRRADIEIKLMSTSDSNDYLTGVAELQRITPGMGVGAFLVRDRNGRSVYQAASTWIVKEPDVSLDKTATPRVWKLRCDVMNAVHGGN